MINEKMGKAVPKTHLSKAYLKEEERNVYRLYRDVIVTVQDKGQEVQEKVGKPIPFGKPLREAQKGEEVRVVVRTVHPTTLKELSLVEIE